MSCTQIQSKHRRMKSRSNKENEVLKENYINISPESRLENSQSRKGKINELLIHNLNEKHHRIAEAKLVEKTRCSP